LQEDVVSWAYDFNKAARFNRLRGRREPWRNNGIPQRIANFEHEENVMEFFDDRSDAGRNFSNF
jgi:hypothetical protein